MFTGIVTEVGQVRAVEPRTAALTRLTITCRDVGSIAIGASIALNGACLTAVARGDDWFAVDAAAETLRVSTVGRWRVGTRVNLERALRLGDELGGHIVAGHVDGIVTLIARDNLPDMAKLTARAPENLARFIAAKGSVALDGVALTINEVAGDTFSVLIIPHTLAVTTLGVVTVGDTMNLEVDLVARYIARLMERR